MNKYQILLSLLFITALSGCAQSVPTSSGESSSNYESISNEINTSQENSSLSSETNIESSIPLQNKIKIYLNPSVQVSNMYYGNKISEAKVMNEVSQIIYKKLSLNPNFIVYANHDYKSLSNSVKEINSLNIDYHLALHTNAGGGTGSEAYYKGNSAFANNLLSTFNQYHSFKNRGIKDGSHLYELKNSNAKNKALIEFLFHDNEKESSFLTSNTELLANSIIETFNKLIA